MAVLEQIVDGRTDLVFDYLAQGHAATSTDQDGVSLIQWCAYYGDVSAIRFLLANGECVASLAGALNAAAFHGHWRLCQYLIENGANVNQAEDETGETPLHSALCKSSAGHDRAVRVLLANGADPNAKTRIGAETGGFMRDARTKGETPLHRAAAFASAETVQLLLDAGALKEARDASGDTPLSWGSWHLRPDFILRKLCYGPYRIREGRKAMDINLLGEPHASENKE
jgi:ankyrin repeat protein